jgi:8-oxo-dGTP pyrophosphatase MutT (NUDIX family)
MTEFMTELELISADGIAAERDVPYLPLPNVVEVVISETLAPDHLTPTAFLFPFFDNGDVQMACNRRRNVEVPGGHRDPLPSGRIEHPAVAARRETDEEAGASVTDLVPVGFMRSTTSGPKPDGYRYPYPVSCQQFFAGRIVALRDFVETDECKAPVRLTHEQAEASFNGRTLELYRAAREALFPAPKAVKSPAP